MVDLHCHLIPGVDDGPPTEADALALARALSAEGVSVVAATSHVNARYPNTAAGLSAGRSRLRDAIAREGIAIDVVGGAEIEAGLIGEIGDEDLRRIAIAGGRWLLVETPRSSHPAAMIDIVLTLRMRGFEVLIAHPERNPHVQRDPGIVAGILNAGALAQVNAGSLVGEAGRSAHAAGWRLVERGLAHLVAGDAHSTTTRPPLMAAAREALARRLDEDAAEVMTARLAGALVTGAGPAELDALRAAPLRGGSRGRGLIRRWGRR
jgi:protein-tyrosine phosphatase